MRRVQRLAHNVQFQMRHLTLNAFQPNRLFSESTATAPFLQKRRDLVAKRLNEFLEERRSWVSRLARADSVARRYRPQEVEFPCRREAQLVGAVSMLGIRAD
jgi:hypothetical protein